VVRGALPPDVVKGKYWSYPFNRRTGRQYFAWEVFDARHNRLLTVEVTRKASVADAKAKASYVRRELADDHTREGRQVVDTGPIAEIAQLADDCVSFSISRKKAARAIPGSDGNEYSMSGQYLYCRFKNINMVVDWEGFNYSRPWALDAGTGLDGATAEQDVERIARAIVAALR
jgi:hypothetical protein